MFTDKHWIADHRFILVRFRHFSTEDSVTCSFERFIAINLSKDVHHSFVVYLRWLEDGTDDGFISEDDIVYCE